jgi:uncharacterized protein YggE
MEQMLGASSYTRNERLILFSVLLGGLLYVAGQYLASQPSRIQQEVEAKREISVQGTGEVQARPDVARLHLTVNSGPQPNAEAALTLLTNRFEAVVDALKPFSIKEEDVKTTNLAINPVYDFTEGRQTLRGFEASESIQVTIRDLEKIGDVLARTTAAGVSQAGGVNLEVDDPTKVQQEAQDKAIADAREKAEHLARQLDVNLGSVKNFSATSALPPQPPFFEARALGQGGDAVAGGPPVPTGTNTITSNVTLTYELR